jgi:hypothetical protein
MKIKLFFKYALAAFLLVLNLSLSAWNIEDTPFAPAVPSQDLSSQVKALEAQVKALEAKGQPSKGGSI